MCQVIQTKYTGCDHTRTTKIHCSWYTAYGATLPEHEGRKLDLYVCPNYDLQKRVYEGETCLKFGDRNCITKKNLLAKFVLLDQRETWAGKTVEKVKKADAKLQKAAEQKAERLAKRIDLRINLRKDDGINLDTSMDLEGQELILLR